MKQGNTIIHSGTKYTLLASFLYSWINAINGENKINYKYLDYVLCFPPLFGLSIMVKKELTSVLLSVSTPYPFRVYL